MEELGRVGSTDAVAVDLFVTELCLGLGCRLSLRFNASQLCTCDI